MQKQLLDVRLPLEGHLDLTYRCVNHRRYYRIAGITIQVDSDLPINDQTFHPKFAAFRTDGPGTDTVTIRHHFSLPDLKGKDLGRELYRKPPWAISQQNGSYIYLGISPQADDPSLHRVATFNADHTRARSYRTARRRPCIFKNVPAIRRQLTLRSAANRCTLPLPSISRGFGNFDRRIPTTSAAARSVS